MSTPADPSESRLFMRRTLAVAVVLLAVLAVVWLAFRLSNILFMVFVALFVMVAFEPPVLFLAKRGWRRGTATGVVLLAALILSVLFFWALVPLFVQQVSSFVESVPGLVESLLAFLSDLGFDLSAIDPQAAGRQLLEGIEGLAPGLLGGVIGLTSTVVGFVFFATTVALFSFYMIAELPQLQRTVLSFMPEDQQRRAMHIWEVAVEKMGGYIYSRLVLAVVSAAVTFTFLQLLGVPFALSLAIWVGIIGQSSR